MSEVVEWLIEDCRSRGVASEKIAGLVMEVVKATPRSIGSKLIQAVVDCGLDGPGLLRIVNSIDPPKPTPPSVDRSRPIKPKVFPTGPRERWGYEGPVTPRLPEKDWWPLRNAVIERDEFVCQYCGDADVPMCADHVVPLSRGGSNEPDNLVACCLPCNSSKSDRMVDEWGGRYQ